MLMLLEQKKSLLDSAMSGLWTECERPLVLSEYSLVYTSLENVSRV